MKCEATLGALYQALREKLRNHYAKNDCATPDLDARLLVAYACGVRDHAPILERDKPVTKEQLEKAWSFIERRLKGEPVARILGEKEFFGHSFLLNEETLVPRPETELMVEETLAFVQKNNLLDEPLKIVDLGVGSGAILVSLLLELPNATGFAIDINPKALDMALLNAQNHNIKDRFLPVCGDFGEALTGTFDIILSNPPYIGLLEKETLSVDVRDFDPDVALFAGHDGLDAFCKLLPFIRESLKKDGFAMLEHGKDQAEVLRKMAQKTGFTVFNTLSDMADLPRFLKIYGNGGIKS